jgi:hypothetical protein
MGAMPAVKVEEEEEERNPVASSPSVSEGSAHAAALASPTAADSIFGRRRKSGPVRRAKGGWTPEEDEKLRKAVDIYNGKNWKKIGLLLFSCLHPAHNIQLTVSKRENKYIKYMSHLFFCPICLQHQIFIYFAPIS